MMKYLTYLVNDEVVEQVEYPHNITDEAMIGFDEFVRKCLNLPEHVEFAILEDMT